MSADKNHNAGRELTAQPRAARDDQHESHGAEQGLSVDADELGRHFLNEATEQGNFESLDGEEAELSIVGTPASDAALADVADSVWDSTVEFSLQQQEVRTGERGGQKRVRGEASGALDLSDDVIREASLLDDEAEEPGEVASPEVKADDGEGRHRRGGGPQSRTL